MKKPHMGLMLNLALMFAVISGSTAFAAPAPFAKDIPYYQMTAYEAGTGKPMTVYVCPVEDVAVSQEQYDSSLKSDEELLEHAAFVFTDMSRKWDMQFDGAYTVGITTDPIILASLKAENTREKAENPRD